MVALAPGGGARSYGARFVARASAKRDAGEELTDRERNALRWHDELAVAQDVYRSASPDLRHQLRRMPAAVVVSRYGARRAAPASRPASARTPRRRPQRRATQARAPDDDGDGEAEGVAARPDWAWRPIREIPPAAEVLRSLRRRLAVAL